ncbi:LamB/YcsF family protein [Virgibacillus halophilus]|uniref:LamB/YcsF family protein n=1 Tax=Tigheibacillus halophilus TaxID=361280 RepID=UPI0036320496
MYRIDLNCDLGESFGAYTKGNDEEILKYVSSANIACGFHAGDPVIIRETVKKAISRGAAIGAHPSTPDLVGFGRRNMDISPEEVYAAVLYQVGAVQGFVQAEGSVLHHVKPHGALYNMAAKNSALAEAIALAVYRVNPELILYGLAGSELIAAGKKLGMPTASEVFADRTYQDDGSLTPRTEANALLTDNGQAAGQVIRMIQEGKVASLSGNDVTIEAETVCIHGDGPHALAFAKTIHQRLLEKGIQVGSID